MRSAYFDCFSGAAGDMIVGSLLAAGCDFEALSAELASLDLQGYSLRAEPVSVGGLAGIQFSVDVAAGEHHHRSLSSILEMIDRAKISPRAAQRAKDIFTRLGTAEAKIHNCSIEQIHFHEVGGVDSIIDIVGTCIALELMGIDRVTCSAIPLGSGVIECEHGTLPVPAPATAELLVGAVTVPGEGSGEMTTPTAAAVFATLSESFGPPPSMTVAAIGYGAGTRDVGPLPNLLRVFITTADDTSDDSSDQVDTVVEITANIDDSSGEVLGVTLENLLAAGALDAWATPIYMKKSRPAWMLAAICTLAHEAKIERLIFNETSTFGLRKRICRRTKLARSFCTVETQFGPVLIKIGCLDGKGITASPEFADCAVAAQAHHVAVAEVMAVASDAYRKAQTKNEKPN